MNNDKFDADPPKDNSILYNPLVSIITPVFNGITYLEECIQSVLLQDYQNIEHVFADGGSTDGTVVRVEKSIIPVPLTFSQRTS